MHTINLVEKIINTRLDNIAAPAIYTFLNPVSYLLARKNLSLFNQFDGIFADGTILVALIRLFYGKKVQRRSFDMTSIVPKLFTYSSENKKSIYVVASHQTEVESAIVNFKKKYPNLIFSGYRNGYFSSEEEKASTIKKIIEIQPDFLIVGMGTVVQEDFLFKAKQAGYNGIGFTCGGFIHQTSKSDIDYYPHWIDKYNLRFIYRIYKEKHTRRRYLYAAFFFPILFLKDRICIQKK